MQLLVAYESDPAGYNMASYIAEGLKSRGDGLYTGKKFDLVIIKSPAISADWLEDRYRYEGYVFLSKHAAESGKLALTCHSTGNFSEALFGGYAKQVAIPHPHLQKSYMRHLWDRRDDFSKFEITIEATHHGPTALGKPVLFIEVGTTQSEWNDKDLCRSVADIVVGELGGSEERHQVAICFGGTHYPTKFNRELIEGEFALGTVVPRHALGEVDEVLFAHILERNKGATHALVDWRGLARSKQKMVDLIGNAGLELVKV
ncbi:MAG: D-aminoacyl-tRNA deacylase [Thaumarchaeota archaeon]|nr:D-aminoacyl-tRNA deacylase [Nitrososphaerota archaeon]